MEWGITRKDKRGVISNKQPRLLSTLGLDDDIWLSLVSRFGKDNHCAVGSLAALATIVSHSEAEPYLILLI